jgi:hypothetical protein
MVPFASAVASVHLSIVVTNEQLLALTADERLDLSRRLAELIEPTRLTPPAGRKRRHRFVVLMTVSCVALIPWTVFLGLTLPHRYVARHWSLTWVGFDVVLMACLGLTATLAWRGRQALALSAFVTATLLACDAWFDITTASSFRDTILSALDAALLELPLACLLAWVGHRLIRAAVTRAGHLSGIAEPPPFWRTPIAGVPIWDRHA